MRNAMQNNCMAAAAAAAGMFSCADMILFLGVTVVASIFVAIFGLQLISLISLLALILLPVLNTIAKKTSPKLVS